NELKLLDGVEVARVAHDDLEGAVLGGQRQDHVFASHGFGYQLDNRLRNGDLGEVDKLQAVELGDGAHDVFSRGVVELDDGVLKLGAGLAGHGAGFFDLVGAQGLAPDKNFGEVAAGFGHGCESLR